MRRGLLLPLVPLYWAGLMAERALRLRFGLGRRRRLGTPVISVGSCSAGGAGKTPVVALLAEVLATEGLRVAVLSRGYGRRSAAVERVLPSGDAARFGDEPLMLSRQSEAAVYVGADRYAAGLLAEREMSGCGPLVFLLDDGFQHRRLERALDVVLLTAEDVRDHLLPAGNLREPLSAVRRADVVVLREEEPGLARVVAELCRRRRMPAIWVIRRRLVVRDQATLPKRALAFCGIARPEGFSTMLAAMGCVPVALAAFRDHHASRAADVERLVRMAAENGADGFVTTEKDAVKLTAAMRARLMEAGPLVVVGLEAELVDRGAAVADLARVLRDARARA